MALDRIGIFGGSFDPIHIGHLVTAIEAADRFHFDRLDFVPVGNPVHKTDRVLAPFSQRLKMVKAGVRACHDARLSVNPYEGGVGVSGYMADTLEWYASKYKRSRFFIVIGADQWEVLHTWKHLERITDLARFVVASRPGYKMSSGKFGGEFLAGCIEVELPICSSEIRRRIREGKDGRSIKFLVPDSVGIIASRLYKEKPCPGSRHTAAASSTS